MPVFDRSRIALALSCLLALTGAGAGQEDPNVARIRQRMAEVTLAAADSLVAEQATDADRADVALVIGALFETGAFENTDPLRAVHYYSLASDYGSAEADCALGNLYYNGAESEAGGLPRDPERARAYYGQAAAGGSVTAMLQLGAIYADGMGVEPDSKRALPYFMDAASRGDPTALERLEPVMRRAREWEEAKPGRKADFPTRREDIVKPELVREAEARNAKLDRLASKIYVALNTRIATAMR